MFLLNLKHIFGSLSDFVFKRFGETALLFLSVVYLSKFLASSQTVKNHVTFYHFTGYSIEWTWNFT